MSDLIYTAQIGIVPHPHSPAEYLIDWVTKSPVHHAILAISETECISCEPGGAIVRPISRFPDAYWSHFDLNSAKRDLIVQFGNANIGKKYGWFADLAIGIALLSGIHTPDWIQRWLNNGNRYECAQFCDAAYTFADVHLFTGIIPSAVFPGMYVPIFRGHGWMGDD